MVGNTRPVDGDTWIRHRSSYYVVLVVFVVCRGWRRGRRICTVCFRAVKSKTTEASLVFGKADDDDDDDVHAGCLRGTWHS